MEQPSFYNTEEELLEWLKFDLKEQNGIILSEEKETSKYFLNIGSDKKKITLKFDFYLYTFLQKLLKYIIAHNDKKIQCPFFINCKNVTFKGVLNFRNILFEDSLTFSNAVFTKDSYLSIENCYFKGLLEFISVDIHCMCVFHYSTFYKTVDFRKSDFAEILSFENVNFKKNVFFQNIIFNDSICFYGTTFLKGIDFTKSLILGEISFERTIFNEENYFVKTKIQDEISFSNVSIEKGVRFLFRDVNYDEDIGEPILEYGALISINDTLICGDIDFDNVYFKKISLSGSQISGDGNFRRVRFNPICEDWQTATVLKHEELKRDNIIGALSYKAIEKDMYTKELFLKIVETLKDALYTTNIITFFKNFIKLPYSIFEWLALFLSKVSNNHGQNWFQAIIFTGVSGLFFFVLSYMPESITIFSLDMKENSNVFYKLGRFFLPVDYSGITKQRYLVNPSLLHFYFIGKAAISYGYVEIVQAFRKLK